MKQHRFYHSSFNSAIFDGPLRIYFSQVFEGQALKIYFHALKQLKGEIHYLKSKVRSRLGANSILIFVYPFASAVEDLADQPMPEEGFCLIRDKDQLCALCMADLNDETVVRALERIRQELLDMEVGADGPHGQTQPLL